MSEEPGGGRGSVVHGEPSPVPVDGALQVIGAPRRSLFDAVRPAEVAEEGSRIRGAGGMALAALRHPGVTGGGLTPADAVVVGGRAFGRPEEGWVVVAESEAVAVGYGIAAVRSRRTAGGRTWVLQRIGALTEGAALEAMAALPTLDPVSLCPVVVGDRDDADRVVGVLRAFGVRVAVADNDDAWSVLSAMDHTARAAESGPAAVVATREGR